ncbi:MAG: SpoIIE family protein phosphatase [Armatimonadetes bacterium]|nr:SpoIIE family protein phosphatase [Armatimonadota bacterium]
MPRLRDAPVAAPPPQPHQRLEERPDDQTPRKTVDTPRALRAALSCLGALVAVAVLWLVADHNYLLFHCLAELLGVIVLVGVFVIAWNSRHFTDNRYLLFLGLASPFIAGLVLLHTLAYKGMGVFAADANLATQLWIARRYVEASAYLGAALAIGRKPRPTHVLLAYALVAVLLLGALFQWRVFPDCYVEGYGLTPFKIVSEHLVNLLLGAALLALLQQRKQFGPRIRRQLAAALAVTILSGLCFTTYVDVFGLANRVGHLLGVVAVYLVYLAIIDTSFRTPYLLLFHELKQSEDALRQAQAKVEAAYQREHRIAASFQNALLLKEHAQVPGYAVGGLYRPALRGEADVGGDFYNLFPLGEHQTGLVVGDVGGKGLEAAVVAAQVQYVLMTLAFAGHSPGEALTIARRIVSADDPDQIITVFLGILSRAGGRLEWASAGHEPALLLHADEERVELLGAGGPPLFGINFGPYPTQTAVLAPGDSLLLYTDGLPEAHAGPDSELLGEEQIAALLLAHHREPPEAVVEAMYQAAEAQAGGRPHDDIALLLLRRQPGPEAAGGNLPS